MNLYLKKSLFIVVIVYLNLNAVCQITDSNATRNQFPYNTILNLGAIDTIFINNDDYTDDDDDIELTDDSISNPIKDNVDDGNKFADLAPDIKPQPDSLSLYSDIPLLITLSGLDSLIKTSAITLGTIPKKEDIILTEQQALEILQKVSSFGKWRNEDDPLRLNIKRLIYQVTQPRFDSVESFLSVYPYDRYNIPWENFYKWDTITYKIVPPSYYDNNNLTSRVIIDSVFNIQHFVNTKAFQDTTIYVLVDKIGPIVSNDTSFPFTEYRSPHQIDTLATAIKALISFVQKRDSTNITISSEYNRDTNVWLNSQSNMATRYWLKNDIGDSVTVWISSPNHNTLNIDLEHGVYFRKPIFKSTYDNEVRIDRSDASYMNIQKNNNIILKKKYWKTRTETSFSLNQTGMTNWVKGGENSVSALAEIVAHADYENKETKVTSANFIRLKYGILASKDYGLRKNVDLLETSSKINTKAFGKFDLSAYMLFKTTIDKGYKYPNDSTIVSKFLNPATMTLGFGLDYKPNKQTSITLSPLSYKMSFVTDTALIDQTSYGIDKDKKSKHEPGFSFLLNNTTQISKQIKMVNTLQLFTNYENKPQNIDIDWELTVTAKINWFTDLKLNTHLIFDDDTKTLEFDKHDKPVTWPDGTQKKNARVQFKEIIGFTLAFTF